MPEDVNDQVAETTEAEEPELVHDDIVKRLLDYQRQLREGAEETPTDAAAAASSVATQTATDELVDLTGGDTLEEDFVDLSADAPDAPPPTEGIATEDVAMASPPPPLGALRDERADASDAEVIVLHPDATTTGMDPDAATSADDVISTSADIPTDGAGHAGAWPGAAPTSPVAPIEEPTPSFSADASDGEAADRILELERRLETLSARFAELRSSFQDMAIAADERLAEIEDLLSGTRPDGSR